MNLIALNNNFAELFNDLKQQLVKICDQDLQGNELFTTHEQLEFEQGFFSTVRLSRG